MYTARTIAPRIIWSFARKSVLLFFCYAAFITIFRVLSGLSIGIPFLPIGLIGSAVAFYIAFKNNSSYERLWESRKIWGRMVNTSRTWGAFVTSFICTRISSGKTDPIAARQELIHRHIAYVKVLVVQLRQHSSLGRSDTPDTTMIAPDRRSFLRQAMSGHIDEKEVEHLLSVNNSAVHMLKIQANRLDELMRQNIITERAYVEMMRILEKFYGEQGASERIKNFPFPRQYAYFSRLFVWVFIILLPFGLIHEFEELAEHLIWLTIPTHVLISWVFNTMEVVADTSENPFDNGINDIPLNAISRTIEIDLLEMLGEDNIPEPLKPVNNILM